MTRQYFCTISSCKIDVHFRVTIERGDVAGSVDAGDNASAEVLDLVMLLFKSAKDVQNSGVMSVIWCASEICT